MLKVTENERLTRVGQGTPMGELMRRYWHPIAAMAELDENPVKPVTLLGESLVLYRGVGNSRERGLALSVSWLAVQRDWPVPGDASRGA